MGFGRSSKLHTAKVLRLSFDLPMVVEIVDTEAKINEFLPTLDAMMAKSILRLASITRIGQLRHAAQQASRGRPGYVQPHHGIRRGPSQGPVTRGVC
jgi:hypothetical protein